METQLRAAAETKLQLQNGIWGIDAGLAQGLASMVSKTFSEVTRPYLTWEVLSIDNSHYWAAQDPGMTVEKMQSCPKVTLWCGMMATNVIGPYFLHTTRNKELY